MKIVKVSDGNKIIFDTNNVYFVENYTESTRSLTPLHHVHNTTDFDFLKSQFSPEHQILSNISNSYYYILGEKQDILEQKAVQEIIAFAKSENIVATQELTESVRKALEVFNTSVNKHFLITHREIAARQLLISAIYALNKEQLDKVDNVVMKIARKEV
ncbi:MAG: hypothetical protein Q4G63_04220 [Bacteroidia bacterium]|nr:hypothetical protein [Bacteroidia bacterium]